MATKSGGKNIKHQHHQDTDKMAGCRAPHHHLALQTAQTDHSEKLHDDGSQKNFRCKFLQSTPSIHTWLSKKDQPVYCVESLSGVTVDSKDIFKLSESYQVELDNQPHIDSEFASQVRNLGRKTSIFTLQTLMQRATTNKASHHKPRPNLRDLQNASHSVRNRLSHSDRRPRQLNPVMNE